MMTRAQTDAWHREIFGWSEDILPWFSQLAEMLPRDARVVIVGCYRGRSQLFLADCLQRLGKTASRVVGIDLASFESTSPAEWVRARNIVQAEWGTGPRVQVELRVMSSLEAAEDFPRHSQDVVFIDANHDEDAVRDDITVWLPRGRGLLCGHDYKLHEFGVARAVDALLPAFQLVPESSVWTWRVP